ncbi:30S ribosomal protein S6 [bacterium]|jgi:small subunit ribosomal protein S6|nr:30S ribosomal protein S6 [bacterium]NDC94775.1 30S ribosomal protein S6 [bacterium]NDD84561.1 30S ribosomal protein S6 [bacterium]NDG30499.1 30S ribosomal protein S6 [bacterium]
MEQYDLAVLYHPDLEIDLEKATAKVEKLIASVDGTITNTDSWGKRKMAYKIKKQDMAIYVFYSLSLPASGVKKINDTLNITDEVLRFLITKPDLKKAAKAEELKAEKAAKQAARGDQALNDDEDEKSDDEDEERPRRRRRDADK